MIIDFLIIAACTGLTAFLLAKFVKYVVLFSKIAFGLLGAIVMFQLVTLVPDNAILNYLAWAAILMASVFLLGLLPRVNLAITFLLDMLLITLVGTIAVQTVLAKISDTLRLNEYILLLIYIVSAGISFRVMMDQVKGGKDLPFFLLRAVDRILDSVINSIALFYCILMTVNLPDNIPLILTAMGGTALDRGA